jgi:hypothetical protein
VANLGHSSTRAALIYLDATRERDEEAPSEALHRMFRIMADDHALHIERLPLDSSYERRAERGSRVSVEASEMVSIPRAELDALKAEVRRLRREVGRGVASARIEADPGPGDDAPTFTREQLADAWGIGE